MASTVDDPRMNNPQSQSRQRLILGLVGWIASALAAGAVGGLASANAGTFYGELIRPDWAPPAWLFGPVWTGLYLMMGVAAWLVWRARGFAGAKTALMLFVGQLVANALWTWLFFVWRLGSVAFAEILVLWVLVATTTVLFVRINKTAGVLLGPYLLWVSFAAALTYATWQLNPDLLG